MQAKNPKLDRELEILMHNICFLQKTNHLSAKAMAKICGISPKSLAKIQKGILPNIGTKTVFNLSKHFRLHPVDLFRLME